MWNSVRSAVKEFVVALNEDEEDATPAPVPAPPPEVLISPPVGEEVVVRGQELAEPAPLPEEPLSLPSPREPAAADCVLSVSDPLVSTVMEPVWSGSEGEATAGSVESLRMALQTLKTENSWMERMWLAEKVQLLRKIEELTLKCAQGESRSEETGASITDRAEKQPEANRLQQRLDDLKEENQLLRVSIQKLLTNIYQQSGILD